MRWVWFESVLVGVQSSFQKISKDIGGHGRTWRVAQSDK